MSQGAVKQARRTLTKKVKESRMDIKKQVVKEFEMIINGSGFFDRLVLCFKIMVKRVKI